MREGSDEQKRKRLEEGGAKSTKQGGTSECRHECKQHRVAEPTVTKICAIGNAKAKGYNIQVWEH